MTMIEPIFKLREDPLICPGSYDLDLYCKYENPEHDFNEFPHIPYDCQTRAQARRIAKQWGWILHKDGTGTCPKCAKHLKELKRK